MTKSLVEFVLIFGISFVLVFGFVRPVVASPVYVDSGSMIPTLHILDRVFINKLADDFTSPERGDIYLFEDPSNGPDPLIKRVVGLPGEEIELRNGRLFVDGERIREPYLNQRSPDRSSFGPEEVPPDHVFVMGDNRSNSLDSRYYGPVPQEDLIGEASFRFWPLNRIGTV